MCVRVAVTDIDTSGIHALEELHRSLGKKGVQVKQILAQIKIYMMQQNLPLATDYS